VSGSRESKARRQASNSNPQTAATRNCRARLYLLRTRVEITIRRIVLTWDTLNSGHEVSGQMGGREREREHRSECVREGRGDEDVVDDDASRKEKNIGRPSGRDKDRARMREKGEERLNVLCIIHVRAFPVFSCLNI
jgi:hypothetical protein